ncbi:HIT family protein [Lactobacillaceae bacterium Melli_B3]
MDNWYDNRIKSAIDRTNPMLMAELKGGFAVFGDTQFLPGYSVLLPKREVSSLNDLEPLERTNFLYDMSILGDAIMHSCNAYRINYDILGNTDQFLHAHVFPRYESENIERRRKPVWLYSPEHWTNAKYLYSNERDDELRNKITRYLNDIVDR